MRCAGKEHARATQGTQSRLLLNQPPPQGLAVAQNHPDVRCAKRSSRSVGKHRLGQGHAHPALHVCPDFRDPLKRVVPLPPPPTSPTLEFPHLAPWEASPRGPGFSQPPRRALLP